LRHILAGLILAAVACTSEAQPPVQAPPRCALSLVAIPTGEQISEEDPLPAGSVILATPDDFDLAAMSIDQDPELGSTVTLRLRGPAAGEFAQHTANHIGDMIAIVLNGDVVSVPVILAPIHGGEISIQMGGLGADRALERFADCVQQ
jgi:hypothetical protein